MDGLFHVTKNKKCCISAEKLAVKMQAGNLRSLIKRPDHTRLLSSFMMGQARNSMLSHSAMYTIWPCNTGFIDHYTANEGPVRIQYKCLVPIYAYPEMKLLFQNHNVLSPSSYTHISVIHLYISRIGLPILLPEICGPFCEYINRTQTYECGNLDWGRAIPRKGNINWIFLAV